MPNEGSCNILKRLNPQDIYFSCVDMSSGFSQIELHEDSRDIFTIILPYGKFRYKVLPQGTASSPEVFNIATDECIKGKEGVFKNVDDIMGSGPNLDDLDKRMRSVFSASSNLARK